MKPSLRDLNAALPTIRFNISTFNKEGVIALSLFFLSACVTVAIGSLVYDYIYALYVWHWPV